MTSSSADGTHRGLMLLFYSLTYVFGLTCNALVIYIVIKHRQVRLKSVANLYIANLALADQMYIISLPLLSWVTFTGTWLPDNWFGVTSCKMAYASRELTKLASAYSLVALSVDRLLASYYSLHAWRTFVVGRRICLAIWVVCAFFALPTHIFYAGIKKRRDAHNRLLGYSCGLHWSSANMAEGYLYYQFTIGLILPSIIILSSYAKLLHRMHLVLTTGHVGRRCGGMKMARTILVVIVAFIICQTPYHIMQFVAHAKMKEFTLLGKNVTDTKELRSQAEASNTLLYRSANIVSQMLVFASSCVNPIIYGLLNDNYRRLYGAVLCCCCPRFNQIRCQPPHTATPFDEEQAFTASHNLPPAATRLSSFRVASLTKSKINDTKKEEEKVKLSVCCLEPKLYFEKELLIS